MKIKADNRGRVSLAQAGIGKPHQEWEVTEDENGVHLTPYGEGKKPQVAVTLSSETIKKLAESVSKHLVLD